MWEHDELLPARQRTATRSIPKRTADCLKAILKLYVVPGAHEAEDPRQQKIVSWLMKAPDDDFKGDPAGAALVAPPVEKKDDDEATVAEGLDLLHKVVAQISRDFVPPPLPDFRTLATELTGSEVVTPEVLAKLYDLGDHGDAIVQRLISAVVASDVAAFEEQEGSLPKGKWVYVADTKVSQPYDTQSEAFAASLSSDVPMRHPFGVQVIRKVGPPSEGSEGPPLLTAELSSATDALLRAAHVPRSVLGVGETTDNFPIPPNVPTFTARVLWNNNNDFLTHVIYDTGAPEKFFFNKAAAMAVLRGLDTRNTEKPFPEYGVSVVMHDPMFSDCSCKLTPGNPHWQIFPAGAGGNGVFSSLDHRYLQRGKHPILVMGAQLLRAYSLSMWFGPDGVHRFVGRDHAEYINRLLLGAPDRSLAGSSVETDSFASTTPGSSGRSVGTETAAPPPSSCPEGLPGDGATMNYAP